MVESCFFFECKSKAHSIYNGIWFFRRHAAPAPALNGQRNNGRRPGISNHQHKPPAIPVKTFKSPPSSPSCTSPSSGSTATSSAGGRPRSDCCWRTRTWETEPSSSGRARFTKFSNYVPMISQILLNKKMLFLDFHRRLQPVVLPPRQGLARPHPLQAEGGRDRQILPRGKRERRHTKFPYKKGLKIFLFSRPTSTPCTA